MSEEAPTTVEALRARVASAAEDLQKILQDATPQERSALLKQIDAETRQKVAPAPTTAPKAEIAPNADSKPDDVAPVPLGVQKPVAEDTGKYTALTQPRDRNGKFRNVLARLRANLGTSGNQGVLDELKKTEDLQNIGNYQAAAGAATQLIGTIDRLDTGALNAESVDNVRLATAELGKVIANLPLPFTNQNQKLRYSDIPPALRDLIDTMITKVEAKIGPKDAAEATKDLQGFMSGSDIYSQSEISSQMNKLLRLLT